MRAKRTTGTSNNFQFAQIVNGEFHVKVEKETPGAIARENKNGVEVHELIYNELEGIYLHEIEIRESEFGKQLQIYLRDEEAREKFFVIQVPLNSGYAYSFLNRAKQVDLIKPVTVKVFEIENKGDDGKDYKTKTITISQNGKMLEKSWSKENNPVPKPTLMLDKKGNTIKKGGYDQYDYTDKEMFLELYVMDELIPTMKEVIKDLLMSKPEHEIETVDIIEGVNDELNFN